MTIDDNDPVALLRWAMAHYADVQRAAHPDTTFTDVQLRELFAQRVLLRNDRTVRRWLDGLTTIPAEVQAFFKRKRAQARHPDRLLEDKRQLTLRAYLWGRW